MDTLVSILVDTCADKVLCLATDPLFVICDVGSSRFERSSGPSFAAGCQDDMGDEVAKPRSIGAAVRSSEDVLLARNAFGH